MKKSAKPLRLIQSVQRALRIVEVLARRLYYMELDGVPDHRVWAYRKAAWAIEDLEQDIGLVYQMMGLKGLASIPGVGSSLAREVESLLKEKEA